MTRVGGGRTALKSGCNSKTQMAVEEGTSVVCVGPKARPAITFFPLWSRAFQSYMAIYLTIFEAFSSALEWVAKTKIGCV